MKTKKKKNKTDNRKISIQNFEHYSFFIKIKKAHKIETKNSQ